MKMSPAGDMKSGTSFVQGWVAGRATQPAGYDIEKPWRSEVNVWVEAAGVAARLLGGALGRGDTEGAPVCRSPTEGDAADPHAASPSAPIAIRATARAADFEYVFMSTLTGPGRRSRRGVTSMGDVGTLVIQ